MFKWLNKKEEIRTEKEEEMEFHQFKWSELFTNLLRNCRTKNKLAAAALLFKMVK